MNDEGSEGMSGGCTRHSLITAVSKMIRDQKGNGNQVMGLIIRSEPDKDFTGEIGPKIRIYLYGPPVTTEPRIQRR